jgi:hypothetical protein
METIKRLTIYVSVLSMLTCISRAEILDRMVAVVEGHVITSSDVRQEREIRTQLGERFTGDDKALAREMIDNFLIDRQSTDFAGLDISQEEIDSELKKYVPQGVPSQAMRDAVTLRIRISKFFELRFQQFIRPTDEEIKKYYDEVFLPEARNRGVDPIPPLAQVADGIRTNLIQEQRNREIDMWLAGVRRRSNIEVFD